MRKDLNDGLHVLQCFMSMVAADATMTGEEAGKTTMQYTYANANGFASERQTADMLHRLLQVVDQKLTAKDLHLCVAIIGSHPRA
eukprot:7736454-Pyramimonas_sp.AAC.1